MNGGIIQPGCTVPPFDEVKLTSIADLAAVPADGKHCYQILLYTNCFKFETDVDENNTLNFVLYLSGINTRYCYNNKTLIVLKITY